MTLGNWLNSLTAAFKKKRSSSIRRKSKQQAPGVSQTLEERQLMTVNVVVDAAAKALVITGTNSADSVQVYDSVDGKKYDRSIGLFGRMTNASADSGYIYVDEGDSSRRFKKDGIETVTFVGLGGDDVLKASGNFTFMGLPVGSFRLSLPVNANGGDGHDSLTGSSNTDTLVGGSGNDSLYGKDGADRLDGGDGNDNLDGWSGNDTIDGGNHNDTIFGGEGEDSLSGGVGQDVIYGEVGNDTIDGGEGHDKLDGGTGNDTINGGHHNDTISGGDGDDLLSGGEWRDVINGDAGNDTIDGGSDHDSLVGGIGNDVIAGGMHNDTISGGDGDDSLSGGDWQDYIYGDAGNDVIDGGTDNDNLWGGTGSDTVHGGDGNDWVVGDAGADWLYGDDGNDQVRGADRGDTASMPTVITTADSDLADFISGGAGNDGLSGNLGNDTLQGDAGNDTLWGGYGDDLLEGNADNDHLLGLAGADILRGGDGNDRLDGGAYDRRDSVPAVLVSLALIDGNDSLFGDEGNDVLTGSIGDDLIVGGAGNDSAYGDIGNDRVELGLGDDYAAGGDGDDVLLGEDGNDNLEAEGGFDTVYGGANNDRIVGGEGDDVLNGDDGNDSLYGERGSDVIYAGLGNDFANGSYGNDSIYGGEGDDSLVGENQSDLIYGDLGNDTINGGDAIDEIEGGGGNDSLYGGNDSDTIRGGFGDDQLFGGDGNDWLYGAGNGATATDRDKLFGQGGSDALLGGKAYDLGGSDIGGAASVQVAKLLNANDLQVSGLGSDRAYVFHSDRAWTKTTANFSTTGYVSVEGPLGTVGLQQGLTVKIVAEKALGTVVKIDSSFSLPSLNFLSGLNISLATATFGFMSGSEVRAKVDPDAPLFDDGCYFVSSYGIGPDISSGTVSFDAFANSYTLVLDPVRGMAYSKTVVLGQVAASGFALFDDLAFRPNAMPDHYTELIGGNIYSRMDGVRVLALGDRLIDLEVGGGVVIDLPDFGVGENRELIDRAMRDQLTFEEIDNLSNSTPNVRLGIAGNLNLSAAYLTARVADSTMILDFDKNEVFLRGQINNNPIENIPILKDAGLDKVLKLNSDSTAIDGYIDLDDVDNSEISFHSLIASLTVDFDEGVELQAEIDTPIIDVKVEGSVQWDGDVYLVGHASAGASFDIKIADVGVKMGMDVVISGNFIEGDLQVDAALNFSIHGIASIDLLFDSLDFGAKGTASAKLSVSLEDFKDFRGSLSFRADVRVYYGPGSFKIGTGGRIVVDNRGLLIDLDDLPSFRIG